MDGDCTEDDDDICQGYFCLTNKVVNGEGRECYIGNNGISSNCSISGTFCDVESNTCYRSYDNPRVTYNPLGHHPCRYHFDCDDGFYCRGGRRSSCQPCVIGDCPDKGIPNLPTCK